MRVRIHPWHMVRRLDLAAAGAMLACLAIGVLFIYSAGYRGDGLPSATFYRRQIVWVVVGVIAYAWVAFVDYRRLCAQAWWVYVGAVVLLILVLLFGVRVYGARRWLSLFGMQVQPSEFTKIAVILALSRYLGRPDLDRRSGWVPLHVGLIVGPVFLLIAAEPDLGTAFVLLPVALAMVFAAGIPLRKLAVIAMIGLLLLPVGWFAMGGYQRERVRVFLDPGRDPLGSGWSKVQSQIAVGSGGLYGKGYLQGTQNVLGFLPRTVAPTDFVFSVVAEEAGFAGAMVVLGLYAVVITGGVRTAIRARDKTGQLLAVGMTALLYTHVFVNIAMTVGVLPVTGLPLPLISYGGSFTIATLLALGLIQSVAIRRSLV